MFIIMPDLLAILIYGPRLELNSRGLINVPHDVNPILLYGLD